MDDKGVIRLQNKNAKIIYFKQLIKVNFGKANYYSKVIYSLVSLKSEIGKVVK